MSYMKPVKRIISNEDLQKWQNSESYKKVIAFIEETAKNVEGKTTDFDFQQEIPVEIKELLQILSEVERIVDRYPVLQDESSSRFGKVEFRDFYDDLNKNCAALINQNMTRLPVDGRQAASEELAGYLGESFGNRTRIDYGSGHELNFICFLICLVEMKCLNIVDESSKELCYSMLILKVFYKYLQLMRQLQLKYWLEPAGSHGVWGLDDYHFLPFLYGAWQLKTHLHLRPKSIHNEDCVQMFKSKYMYFECIAFINSIKTTTLRWHSPMLDDISNAKSWTKIAEGMIKMYKVEVLGKLPIIQHFLFGSVLQCPEGIELHNNHKENQDSCHAHTWGDCCGIKLPSAIAAHEVGYNSSKSNKPIPFD